MRLGFRDILPNDADTNGKESEAGHENWTYGGGGVGVVDMLATIVVPNFFTNYRSGCLKQTSTLCW